MKKLTKALLLSTVFALVFALSLFAFAPVAFASDGTAPEPSAGQKVRDWVYAQAEPLVAGISASTLLGTIMTVFCIVIERRGGRRMNTNNDTIKKLVTNTQTLFTTTETAIGEIKTIKAAIEDEIATLKKLKKVEDIEAVESASKEILESIDELDKTAETAETENATPFLRS